MEVNALIPASTTALAQRVIQAHYVKHLSVITTVSTMVNVLNQRVVLALQGTVAKDARYLPVCQTV